MGAQAIRIKPQVSCLAFLSSTTQSDGNMMKQVAILSALVVAEAGQLEHVEINVYYETNCPFSQNFIVTEMKPFTDGDCATDRVTFHDIAYGMASDINSCQHGEDECIGNRVNMCAKKALGEGIELDRFVQCMLDSMINTQALAASVFSQCHARAADFLECAKNPGESDTLMLEAKQQTEAGTPTQAPFVVIANDAQLATYNLYGTPLLNTVCEEISNPPACCPPAVRKLAEAPTQLI